MVGVRCRDCSQMDPELWGITLFLCPRPISPLNAAKVDTRGRQLPLIKNEKS